MSLINISLLYKEMASCVVFLIIALVMSANDVYATDYKPWYGRVFELNTAADIRFQLFNHVNTHDHFRDNSHHGLNTRKELDTFIDLSASMALDQDIALQLEVIGLQSKLHSFRMDAIRLTPRYRLLNDIVGDPVSLSLGMTLSSIFSGVRKNIATFDHGGMAAEAHISIGREISCMQFWTSRTWGVLGVGIADVGSPWLRANFSYEHNFLDTHRLRIFTESLFGFGSDNLNQFRFHGYGSIDYQAIDLGVRYTYQADYGVLFSCGYGYRVYARNCPENVNFILFRLDYPL